MSRNSDVRLGHRLILLTHARERREKRAWLPARALPHAVGRGPAPQRARPVRSPCRSSAPGGCFCKRIHQQFGAARWAMTPSRRPEAASARPHQQAQIVGGALGLGNHLAAALGAAVELPAQSLGGLAQGHEPGVRRASVCRARSAASVSKAARPSRNSPNRRLRRHTDDQRADRQQDDQQPHSR